MNREQIEKVLDAVKEVAPDVEAAVVGVKDTQLRSVIASAIIKRILDDLSLKGTNVNRTPLASHISTDELSTSGTQGRILDIQKDGFFVEPRLFEQVQDELRTRGHHHNTSDIRMSLLRLTRKKLLRRIPIGSGKRQQYSYVNP